MDMAHAGHRRILPLARGNTAAEEQRCHHCGPGKAAPILKRTLAAHKSWQMIFLLSFPPQSFILY